MTRNDELVGIELRGQRGSYRLTKYLGEGKTARVYVAEARLQTGETLQVAVKAMRPGLGAIEQAAFRSEATNLAQLFSLDAKATPIFYEHFSTQLAQAPEALVLELMTGVQIADWVTAHGPLSEPGGLALAKQLAELLAVLHGRARRTYTDLKLENLWWNAAEGQLKVTDWNVLSESNDLSRAPIDLLRAARYAYTVLTGGAVLDKAGIVTTDFRQHPGWSALSLAAQNVFGKAFHRNTKERYQTADELVRAFDDILVLWQRTVSRLLREAEAILGDDYKRENYAKAHEWLEVLNKRRAAMEAEFSSVDSAKLDELLAKVRERLGREQTTIERGEHLFLGRSFREAMGEFVCAIDENPFELSAWRWREAARAGHTTTGLELHTRDVKQALDALKAGEYARAESILVQIGVSALDGVLYEARTRRLLGEAERSAAEGQQLIEEGQGDTPEAESAFQAAQQAYAGAGDTFRRIVPQDYRDQLLAELGDVAERGRELVDEQRSIAAAAGRALRAAEAAATEARWETVYREMDDGLKLAPQDARLRAAAADYGRKRLQVGDLQWATAFLRMAADFSPANDPVRLEWRAASGTAASVALLEANQWEPAFDQVEGVLSLPVADEIRRSVRSALKPAIEALTLRPQTAPSLAALKRGAATIGNLANVPPVLLDWANQSDARWPDLVAEWLLAREPAWNPETLKSQVAEALRLSGSGQKVRIADAVMPVVRKRIEAALGWWTTPAVAELFATARLLRGSGFGFDPFLTDHYCRLISADVNLSAGEGKHLEALDRVRSALAITPPEALSALAQRLQGPLKRILESTPPDGNLVQASVVLKAAQDVLGGSAALSTGSWKIELDQYRSAIDVERSRRQRIAMEHVQDLMVALRATGDKSSRERAKSALDEALALTDESSPVHARLRQLERELAAEGLDDATRADRLQAVKTCLGAYPERLGKARTEADFETLKLSLTEARSQAEQLNDIPAMNAATEALAGVQTARGQRPQAVALEERLAALRDEIGQLTRQASVPGIGIALEDRWRKVGDAAAELLKLHPGHAEAVKAQADYQEFRGSGTLADRLAMYRQLKDDVGEPAAGLEQATAMWQSGRAKEGRTLLDALPQGWQEVPEVAELRTKLQQAEGFLADAAALKQTPMMDPSFGKKLQSLLQPAVPAAYVSAAGLAAWLKGERDALVSRLAAEPPGARNADLLGEAVCAEQYCRLVTPRPPVPPGAASTADAFVFAALKVLDQRPAPNMAATPGTKASLEVSTSQRASRLDVLLAQLATSSDPLKLAGDVSAAVRRYPRSGERSADGKQGSRRNLLGTILQAVIQVVTGVLLVTLAGLVIFSLRPQLQSAQRALATGTAVAKTPAAPMIVQVTVMVTPTGLPPTVAPIAIHTPEATFAPTATNTPSPSPTHTPTGKPTATWSPSISISDTERFRLVLAGLQVATPVAGVLPLTTTLTISTGLVSNAATIIALLDDNDSGAWLFENGQTAITPTLQSAPSHGLFGGMKYVAVPADNPQRIQFEWQLTPQLGPGRYRLFVYLPNEHGLVRVAYSAEPASAQRSTAKLLNQTLDQNFYYNRWGDLGDFLLKEPDKVRIAAQLIQGTQGEAGFDAIAIVRLPD